MSPHNVTVATDECKIQVFYRDKLVCYFILVALNDCLTELT